MLSTDYNDGYLGCIQGNMTNTAFYLFDYGMASNELYYLPKGISKQSEKLITFTYEMELFKSKPSHFSMELHPVSDGALGVSPCKKNKIAKSDINQLITLFSSCK